MDYGHWRLMVDFPCNTPALDHAFCLLSDREMIPNLGIFLHYSRLIRRNVSDILCCRKLLEWYYY
jgi:hypothetical protein